MLNPTKEAIMAISEKAEKELAHRVLTVLRKCRDEAPREWDHLVNHPAGYEILNLWDSLRKIEK